MYFSPNGEPMEMLEWANLFEKRREDLSPESWWRKRTEVGADLEVSTVWLGLNHRWSDGPPLIWETMIFGGDHDLQCWRYSSRQAAYDDHERIVRALVAGRDPEEVSCGAW